MRLLQEITDQHDSAVAAAERARAAGRSSSCSDASAALEEEARERNDVRTALHSYTIMRYKQTF